MFEVLLCLVSGFLAARFLRMRTHSLLRPLTYAFIFLIGIEVGSGNPYMLPELFLQSLAITLSALSGSILALYASRRLR